MGELPTDDRQEDKLSMYLVVSAHLTENQTVWQAVPAFVNAENAFRAEVDGIQSLAQAQDQPSAGVTADKQRLRGEMAEAAMPVVGALKTLAAVTSDGDLAAQAGLTRSDFVYGRDTQAADRADIVHDLAAARAADLADYGIAQAQIDSLRTVIDAYRDVLTRPREVIAATAAATAQLDEAFARADAVLTGQLDNLVELFRQSQAAFYLGYQNARQIVDSPGGSPPPPPPS